jgi:hypothetical protein
VKGPSGLIKRKGSPRSFKRSFCKVETVALKRRVIFKLKSF